MNNLLEEALYYKTCGLSVVIRDKTEKRPIVPWKEFQEHIAAETVIRRWFTTPAADAGEVGVCIIAGKVSRNLLVFDFDEVGIFEEFWQICVDNEIDQYLIDAPLIQTTSNGRHLYVRGVNDIGRNTKLAYTADKKVRIETRASGGLAAAPPTTNSKGLAYKRISGSFAAIPVLDDKLIQTLMAFARLFNEYVPPEYVYEPANTMRVPGQQTRPGDDYNDCGDIRPILERHGWRPSRARRGTVEMWTRPGKDDHSTSATLGYGQPYFFYPFSSNASPFESEKAYTFFAAYAILEHGGDFREAAKDLGEQGFGTAKEQFVRAILTQQREKRGDVPPDKPTEAKPVEAHAENEPAILLGRHELNDIGNANRFVRMWRNEMRYDHSVSAWYVWNGVYWEEDKIGLCLERAKKIAHRIYIEAGEEGLPDDIRKALVKHASSSHGAERLKAMVSLAKSDPSFAVTHEVWDSNAWLLNVKNGTIELKTGAFREHQRTDMITHMSQIEYNPVATCPTWDKCLEQWQPSEAIRAFLRRSVGYSLTGSAKEQKLFYLYGSGANGKSVFLETCRYIIGGYWVKAKADSFMRQQNNNASGAQPDIVALIGKRFVTTSEVSQSQRLNEALVKDITGGDTFAVRDLYRGMVNFTPQCKMWFFGNHKPKVDANDSGIWRRFLLVNFGVVIPVEDRDPDLLDKLHAEVSGILNWALEGCKEWRKSGLMTPDEINNDTTIYRQQEDVIGRFVEDACIFAATNSVTSTQIYDSFLHWCKKNGEHAPSQRKFSDDLVNRGFNKQKTATANKFIGVTVRTMAEISGLVED